MATFDPASFALPGRSQPVSRRMFLAGAAAGAATLATASPAWGLDRAAPEEPLKQLPSIHATDWIRTMYQVVLAEGLTPPAAARFYHYVSVAMYETAVPAMPAFRSLAGQLPGLERAPLARRRIDAPSALAAAVKSVSLGLLPAATAISIEQVTTHHDRVMAERTALIGSVGAVRSGEYGAAMGAHLLRWMAADGYAEASTLPYTPPVGADKWRSTPPNFGTAIEPHWAMVRPAILSTADEVVPADHIPFSSDVGSAFYEQALATYNQSFQNTEDQIATARFWTDNPRVSGLPSGHWFLVVADQADGHLGLSLDRTLEGFVRLGVALHDSFLNCWTWKYRFNLIRPVSYVIDYIDPAWATLVNTPQFPEYTSGHSVASGAAEVVLTALYGEFAFTDTTGVARSLPARSFTSFAHAAQEAASSRIYGGIHYPMGIEHGMTQGRSIGLLVNQRLQTSRPYRPGTEAAQNGG